MSKKRAAAVLKNGKARFPDELPVVTGIVDRINKAAVKNATDISLDSFSNALWAVMGKNMSIAPYVAQSFPGLLSTLFAHCQEGGEGGAGSASVLRLCERLTAFGVSSDELDKAVTEAFDVLFKTMMIRSDAVAAACACKLLGRAIRFSDNGDRIARRVLSQGDEKGNSPKGTALLDLLRATLADVSNESELRSEESQIILEAVITLTRHCVTGREAEVPLLEAVAHTVSENYRRGGMEMNSLTRDALLSLTVVLALRCPPTRSLLFSAAEDLTEMSADVGGGGNLNGQRLQVQQPSAVQQTAIQLFGLEGGVMTSDCVRELYEIFADLGTRSFQGTRRLASLQRAQEVLFSSGAAADPFLGSLVCLTPGAVPCLVSAVGDIDESISIFTCQLLARLLGTSELSTNFSEEGGLSAELLGMGIVGALEDMLSDYSAGVVAAALELLIELLGTYRETSSGCFAAPITRDAVLASLCLTHVTQLLNAAAQKEDTRAFITESENHRFVFLALDLIDSAGLDELECRILDESAVAAIGTLVSEARGDTELIAKGLAALTRLASAFPYATSMLLDFDFISEVLAIDDSPVQDSAAILVGSLNVMAAMVPVHAAAVTFEWIETLLSACQVWRSWRADVPGYSEALWLCLRNTLEASEDSREYMFDDTTIPWLAEALTEATTEHSSLLALILRVAAYVPDKEMSSLMDSVEHAAMHTRSLNMEECEALSNVLAVVTRVERKEWDSASGCASPERLVHCLVAVLRSGASLPVRTPSDCLRCCSIGEQLFAVLRATGIRGVLELVAIIEETLINRDESQGTGTASIALPLLYRALVQGGVGLRTGDMCERLVQLADTALTAWEGDTRQELELPRAYMLRCVCKGLEYSDAAGRASAAARIAGPTGILTNVAHILSADSTQAPNSASSSVVVDAAYVLLEALFSCLDSFAQEPQYHLFEFIADRALCNTSRLSACRMCLLSVLNHAPLREWLLCNRFDGYRDALECLQASEEAAPMQLRISVYVEELSACGAAPKSDELCGAPKE